MPWMTRTSSSGTPICSSLSWSASCVSFGALAPVVDSPSMLVRADVGAEAAVVVVVASAPSLGAGAPMMRLRRLANRPRAGDSSRLGVLVESAIDDELEAARARPCL